MELYVGRFGTMQLSVKLAAKRGAVRAFISVQHVAGHTKKHSSALSEYGVAHHK